MKLYHATTRTNLPSIQATGLRVANADPAAKLKGCWFHTASQSPWAVVHTIRKHKASLTDVVVIEVSVSRRQLTRFKTGLWYSKSDIPNSKIGRVIDGTTFGASASE